LFDLTSGEVILDGTRIDNLSASALRPLRKRIAVIFQDPFSSLNPRMRVHDIIAEPIRNFGLETDEAKIKERVAYLLDKVRLSKDAGERWPHEFSGGQRQRICIARALAAEPDLIICDEAVSALDVSVKAQIVNLLQDLQKELGLALLFISHDLAIVEHMTHRVAVMYLGRIVELATRTELFSDPKHPYTSALLSAVPVPDPEKKTVRTVLQGDVPSPVKRPTGCHFHTRCPEAIDICKTKEPKQIIWPSGRMVACHLREV
jgi:peptide/nickel transport system ATP-binding protein